MRKLVLLFALFTIPLAAQQIDPPATQKSLSSHDHSMDRSFEQAYKDMDDVLWYMKVGDVAAVDKFQITSKPGRSENTTGQGAGNPLVIPVYTFTPKSLRGKAPMIVFVHGGVHGDFDTFYAHIVRELIEQGYVIVAPEYRGSTGYGGDFYDEIDYGGAEIDDVKAARDWAVENLPSVDGNRVGIIGWSHGGYQTLLNIFRWPDAYKVAYAGVPVSDLVQRMGYKSQGYRNTFKEFIGKEAVDNPMEYRKRSPVYHASELATPLLIHTNTNDEDVNVMEVEHLIDALKAAGKKFEYKIYQNAPGGHTFNRIDTKLARESRQEIYAFLAKYLK
ncbi:MAG: alpha/beta hydrolase family protein [Thermoanaerobaculia bacterium]